MFRVVLWQPGFDLYGYNRETMKNIHRVICFDLDGTLLDQDERIRPNDLARLKEKQNGTLYIPASGRSLKSVKSIFYEHGIISNSPIPFPMILQNGAVTYLPEEKIYSNKVFETSMQESLIKIIDAFYQIPFFMVTSTHHYVLHANSHSNDASQRYKFKGGNFTDNEINIPLTKIMGMSQDISMLQELMSQISSLTVESAFSLPTIVEITPPGANKGNGLMELLRVLEVPENVEILVAGDGENDLSLFPIATRSYAPLNAAENVRLAADKVITRFNDGLFSAMLSGF